MNERGLVFDERGLVPVVVQDRRTGEVLMVAYASPEAVDRTRQVGLAHFWSRRRLTLWQKGETSGNRLRVVGILADCDRDALLYLAEPTGPVCHVGERSCFHQDLDGNRTIAPGGVLPDLEAVIAARRANPVEGSYTTALLTGPPSHLYEKVYEEAAEVVRAAREEGSGRLAEEAADLVYHLLVLLQRAGVPWSEVLEVLSRRRSKPHAGPP